MMEKESLLITTLGTANLESKARVVFQGCQDHVVLKETLVRRVSKDRWVREGRLDPLECLAHLD